MLSFDAACSETVREVLMDSRDVPYTGSDVCR